MLTSFSEFKFYQSYRIPVEHSDGLRFVASIDHPIDGEKYIDDAKLVDISISGLGFQTEERISVGSHITFNLFFKRHQLELSGNVVRAFTKCVTDQKIIYGIELDEEKKLNRFLEQYILSFNPERLKECLIQLALKERYTDASEGFEMFSLLLSLFKDITYFGDKEGFLETMLEEVVRILNATRASIFLINADTNELEAVSALGVPKDQLKFDYRLGIAGSVFTTGVALNIDTSRDSSRFNEFFDRQFNFETRSIICYPIQNREDKIVGVIEVINKRNQDRFTIEDEKTMKVMALVFSSVFHNFNPMSESSKIRRFSKPFDRKHAIIGKTTHINSLRNTILKVKDLDSSVLISGENGVGKTLFAKIIHHEGQRGLKPFEIIDCGGKDERVLQQNLWGSDEKPSALERCQGGTILFKDISKLSLDDQKKLKQVFKNKGLPNSKYTLDIRVMATSVDDLSKMSIDGGFDPELLDHVSKAFINIDPLRKRQNDIPDLIDYFLKLECKKQGLLLKNFSPRVMNKFIEYEWPGNIRELKTCVERAVLYNPKTHIITDLDLENSTTPLISNSGNSSKFGELPFVNNHHINLKDRLAIIEKEMILGEIKRNNGNKSKAAKEMGISREALRKKLLNADKIIEALESNSSKKVQLKKVA